jgi:hypothetical protein
LARVRSISVTSSRGASAVVSVSVSAMPVTL